ncbi:hypothetical protein [Prosthecobacter sp.]
MPEDFKTFFSTALPQQPQQPPCRSSRSSGSSRASSPPCPGRTPYRCFFPKAPTSKSSKPPRIMSGSWPCETALATYDSTYSAPMK